MADNQGNKVAKDYHLDVKPAQEGFTSRASTTVIGG